MLPRGGEVETVASESTLAVNFYLGGALVLAVVEQDGEAVAELTEHVLALSPELAAGFVADLEAALPSLMTGERCTGPLRTKGRREASVRPPRRRRWRPRQLYLPGCLRRGCRQRDQGPL